MDYKKAWQRAQMEVLQAGSRSTYMVVTIGFNRMVLPYKNGLKLLESIEGAELMDGFGHDQKIKPMDGRDVETSILSQESYRRYKIAQLLGISYDGVIELENTEE